MQHKHGAGSDASSRPVRSGELVGVVTETLPNTMFRVDVGDKVILTYLSGKMRMHKIKVLIGDRVLVELDQYGERGRIIRRG